MPRRRSESPPTDRLAFILGLPLGDAVEPDGGRAAEDGRAADEAFDPELENRSAWPLVGGWIPQRPSVDRLTTASPQVPPEPMIRAPTLSDAARHRRPAPPRPAILTVPVALRGVRAKPRRLAVLGVLLVLVAAAVVLGVRVAWARSSAQPRAVAASRASAPGGLVPGTVPAAFASAGATGLPTVAGVLLVHVVGQVRHPGVVRLPPGARVLDAVKAAGGATPTADLNRLNLARPVADGEQIVVPKPGETLAVGGVPAAGGTGSGPSGQGLSGGGTGGGLIDLNSADASALDSLPGVGPVLAQRILDWRAAHGRFSSVDELGEVTGIGDKLMAQIRPKVKV